MVGTDATEVRASAAAPVCFAACGKRFELPAHRPVTVASELQRDWRNDVEGFGKLISSRLPGYRTVIGSHVAGQTA